MAIFQVTGEVQRLLFHGRYQWGLILTSAKITGQTQISRFPGPSAGHDSSSLAWYRRGAAVGIQTGALRVPANHPRGGHVAVGVPA